MLFSKVNTLLKIPYTVYSFYQSQKTSAKNVAVAFRINNSRMRNQMEAHSAVAYLIEQLIYNQKFKLLLKKAISNIKNDRFYRAKDRITYVYNWTN